MSDPNDFFTMQSLGTFLGATGATFTVTNAIQRAFQVNPAWLGLAVAEAVCLGTVALSSSAAAADFFVAVINGFLVFCSAAGGTALGGQVAGAAPKPLPQESSQQESVGGGPHERRAFLTPWL